MQIDIEMVRSISLTFLVETMMMINSTSRGISLQGDKEIKMKKWERGWVRVMIMEAISSRETNLRKECMDGMKMTMG